MAKKIGYDIEMIFSKNQLRKNDQKSVLNVQKCSTKKSPINHQIGYQILPELEINQKMS